MKTNNTLINIKNSLASTMLIIFYFCSFTILIIQFGKYLIDLSFIEDFILFIPRWLIFCPLFFSLILYIPLNRYHIIATAILALLLLTFYVSLHIPLPSIKNYSLKPQIRVMSLNLNGSAFDAKKLNLQIKYNQPDVMVFQEAPPQKLKNSLPNEWLLNCQKSLCLASKEKSEMIDFRTRRMFDGWGTFAALFELKISGQLTYILNIHLETPRKAYENIRYGQFDLTLMKNIYEQRYLEASLSKGLIANYHPLIIAGDFNMPSDSFIYQEIFPEFKNAFNEKGFGLGNTKHTKILGAQIDHILVNKNVEVINSWVDIETGSDHRPIFADILIVPASIPLQPN
jgi:endonuclease/exonuclease/phosphatase (EEP) superfamily protein YafD